jgi:folylpolyglutamate synthase/dihydropteroate synthase
MTMNMLGNTLEKAFEKAGIMEKFRVVVGKAVPKPSDIFEKREQRTPPCILLIR